MNAIDSLLLPESIAGALTVKDVASKTKRLVESAKAPPMEPLAKTYTQWLKRGNTYSPTGPATLTDALAPCPYSVEMTINGVVFERVKPLTDEIIRFSDSRMDDVVREVDRFWESKEAYNKLGLCQTRGVLLYGPPGTGKSICLQQVTEAMSTRGDVVFFVKSPEAIHEAMKAFRDVEPDRKVVVSFEEADEMCRYNERAMLRIMDGDAKVNGVLFLATTNYIDRLPPRMLRPGRFGAKYYIGYPTMEQRLAYLTHKLTKGQLADAAQIKVLAEKTDGMGFGHLRELIADVYAVGMPIDRALERLKDAHDPTPETTIGTLCAG